MSEDYLSINGKLHPSYTKKWYDQATYDTLAFRKKRGAKHEVGHEVEGIIPSAAEIRLLGNRHKQCKYY